MHEPPPGLSPAERAGERAAKNTIVRATAEIIGKVASFILFAAIARTLGQSNLGIFVFAFAFLRVAMLPIDLGLDRYMLREVARSRSRADDLFFNVLVLKLALSVPVLATSMGVLSLLGYSGPTRDTVYVLAAGLLCDLFARSIYGFLLAHERGELIALSIVVQRIGAAGIGLAALAAGFGVVAMAASYTLGAALGLLVGLVLLKRKIGLPRLHVARARWRALAASSLPFAAQEILTGVLFKLDAVILSVLTVEAAVGRYGAAYQLFESSFFLIFAVVDSFSAMFTYLGRDSQPTLAAVFQRAIKLGLATLVPLAVAFGTLAEPLARLFFGDQFAESADPLRLLAPAVVMLGLVTITSSLIVSRRSPRMLAILTAAAVAINVMLNFALIPRFDDSGAAAAMLVTETLLAAVGLRIAIQTVGGFDWLSAVTGPIGAGLAMLAVMLLFASTPALALAAGVVAYLVALVLIERIVSPLDLEFMVKMVRRRLPARPRR